MANVKISDLAQAILPLVGTTTFFEVEATEGGVVVSRKVAAADIEVDVTAVVGTSIDDPTAPGTFNANLQWQNALAAPLANVGYNTDTFFDINNVVHGGNVRLRAETAAGVLQSLFQGDPSAGAILFFNGLQKITSANQGILINDASTNNPATGGNQNVLVDIRNGSAAQVATLGYAISTALRLKNFVHGGVVELVGEDAGGVERNIFLADPDGIAQIFNVGVATLRTTTAAAGGAEANNTLTGGGFERVLTTADISVTPALGDLTDVTLTAPATGAVLYKSAGDWLDTPGILIDPLADVKLHQATVEVFRTLTAAAGGAEANNTLTGAGFERVLTASDAFTGIIEGSSVDSPETPGGTWDGVLRFDNANSLQTARVGFEPAGDTFFVQATVEGGRLILGGRSPGAPGPLREAIVIDFDTGALPAGSTRFFEANGTAEQMRLDTGVSAVTEVANVLNNPASGLAQHGQFRITNINAQQSGEFGFPATGGLSTTMRMKNFVHGGPVELVGENAAGTERTLFFYDPDNSGPIIFGPLDNPPTTDASIQDTRLTFRNPSAQTIWQIGFLEGTNDFSLKLFQDTGTLRLRGSSAASADVVLAIFDPVADAKLFQAGAEVFRTVAAASGGAQANNTATGAGFERVLTTADIAAAPSLGSLTDVTLTAPATGAVLYKSAGDWLDTPAITIDPAAAVQVFHAGVGTPKFRTTANGFDLLGDTATNSDFDFYSLDGVTLRASLRTDGAGLRIASQPNSLSVTIFARSGAGAELAGLQVTGSTGITQLYFSGAIKLLTQSQGVTVRGNAVNNVQLLLEGSSGIDHFQINGVGSNITLNSTIDGSSVRFTGEDLGSVNRLMLDMDPDGEVNLYRIGVLRAHTRFDGWTINGLLTNNPATGGTQDVSLNLENQSGALAGGIRYTSGTDLRIENFVHGGDIVMLAEDAGGVIRSLVTMDPDGANSIELFEVGVSVARTATAALGGFFVNNTLTGAGFERALTTADRTSAAAYTPTNVVTTRTYDANATSIDELADVLGTLIADLQAINVIQ